MNNFDFDVRLSAELFNQLHEGEITPSMLLTMGCLYNWADWSTGIVKNVSAGGLVTWTREAYCLKTFHEALRRLEWMGWITRHRVQGSHRSYAVTIHNYKAQIRREVRTENGSETLTETKVVNPKELRSCWDENTGTFAWASTETASETATKAASEASRETATRTNLKTNLKSNLNNQSQIESQDPLSKEVSEQVSPSFASLTTAPSPSLALGEAEQEQNQPRPESGDVPEQKQQPDAPQTFQEMIDMDDFTTSSPTELLFKISPNITDAMVREQLPICQRILTYFSESRHVADEFAVLAAEQVLKYNRAHRSGKYASKEDKKLLIRTAKQFLKALESDSASLMNDYLTHGIDECEVCLKAGVSNYRTLIKEILKDRDDREEARLRAIEQEKLAAEEKLKQERWAAYVFAKASDEQKKCFHGLRTFDINPVIASYKNPDGTSLPSIVYGINAVVRYFADRNTPFDREEWDAMLADAAEAYLEKHNYAAAAGDVL